MATNGSGAFERGVPLPAGNETGAPVASSAVGTDTPSTATGIDLSGDDGSDPDDCACRSGRSVPAAWLVWLTLLPALRRRPRKPLS